MRWIPAFAGTSGQQDCLFLLVLEIYLDRSGELDRQRIAIAILGLANFDPYPAFADAIFADIGLLDALEAYADIALERVGIVIRAARIVGQSIGRPIGPGVIRLWFSRLSLIGLSFIELNFIGLGGHDAMIPF